MTTLNFNGQNQDLINSDGYRNYNNLISSEEFLFYYNDSKFLWKELMKINAKYIERSKDLSSLEPYVENILYSRLLFDDIDMLSNEYILQLVTLLQLTGQYLVYSQKKLESENQELEERLNDFEDNYKNSEKYQILIDNLNRQNQEKDFLIKTYQNMIKGGYGKDINNNMAETDINLKKNKDGIEGKKEYYFCKFCANKKFRTQQYLDDHMKRRHYYALDSERENQETRDSNIKEKNNKKEFEEKLNSMKEYFEKLIKQNQENNDFSLLYKRIDDLSNKIISQNVNGKYNNEQYVIGKKYPSNINSSQKNMNQISGNNKIMENQKNLVDDLKNFILGKKLEMDEQMKQLRNDGDKYKYKDKDKEKIINNKTTEKKRDKTTEENINIKTKTNIIIDKETTIKEKIIENNIIQTKNQNKEKEKENKNENDYKNNNNYNNNDNNNLKISNNEKQIEENLNESKKDNNILQSNQKYINKPDEEDNKIIDEIKKVDDTKIIANTSKKSEEKIDETNKEEKEENVTQSNIIKESNKESNKEEENKKNNENENNESKKKVKYKESLNTNSPKFSYNPNQESQIHNNEIKSFYEKMKERDDNYEGNVDNYYKKIIATQPNKEEIEDKINEKINEPNFINFKNIEKKIADYKLKYLNEYMKKDEKIKFGNDLYKALDLDKIFNEFKNYKNNNYINSRMSERNNTFSTNNKNNISNKENSDSRMNRGDSNNQTKINQTIQNQNNNNNTYRLQTSLQGSVTLLEQNFLGQNNPKQSVNQNVVIGHDLTYNSGI